MKPEDPMTARVEAYLRFRRAFGYALRIEGQQLLGFARYAEDSCHSGPLTSDIVLRWVRLPSHASRVYYAKRLELLSGFARYCRLFDPLTEFPPKGIFGSAHERRTPYIYSDEQLAQLVSFAPDSGFGSLTCSTIFGLLACTGMRVSEALRLEVGDVDLSDGIIRIRKSKCRRLRLVPLHTTAAEALRTYALARNLRFPQARFFFVNRKGEARSYPTVRQAFRQRIVELGWHKGGRRPRLHDLRHTFACRVLQQWSRRAGGVEDRLDWLSRYLGHERLEHTYWYLSAVPELFADAVVNFSCPDLP